jgi:pimeloyl-ACP methyl ester carboxylesterase
MAKQRASIAMHLRASTGTRLLGYLAIAAVLGLHLGCPEFKGNEPHNGAQVATASADLAAAAKPNAADPRWIAQANPKAKHAIVFIHGLFGDTIGTWTHSSGTRFFDLIGTSSVGKHFDLYAFGYTSKMLGPGSLNIVEAIGKLNEYLKFHGVLDYESITFVGHSMGGLVILQHLIDDPALRRKVALVALYATPQEGAQIAVIGDKVARNPALAQLVPSDANAYLQKLDADWKRLPERDRPFVSCGYETKPLAGVTVVPYQSATRFCSRQALAIEDADHLAVVKPDRPEHPSVVLLVNALRDHVISPPAGNRKLDIKMSFTNWPQGGLQSPPALEMLVEDPEPQGPFAFIAGSVAGEYLHHKFLLPAPGERFSGYVTRVLYTAYAVGARTDAPPLKTRLCMKVTNAPMPPDRSAAIKCAEGDGCVPRDANGPLAACGGGGNTRAPAHWFDWLPLRVAAAQPSKADEPARGDWIVPRLETLLAERSKAHGEAFSEVTITFDGLSAEDADAITFEARINDRRLWVNGLPSWAHAQPWAKGSPVTVKFGIENLNSAGKFDGAERLDVRVLLLKDKRPMAEDTVALSFQALRTIPPSESRSRNNRPVRWSATYYPGPQDQYQIFAFGDAKATTLRAKIKFDDAKAAGTDGLPLVGVVRPPLKSNPNWGISVGQVLPTGQIKFSFSRDGASALCKAMMADAARPRLMRSGFGDPAQFGVREIAFEKDDGRPKQRVPCGKFSLS